MLENENPGYKAYAGAIIASLGVLLFLPLVALVGALLLAHNLLDIVLTKLTQRQSIRTSSHFILLAIILLAYGRFVANDTMYVWFAVVCVVLSVVCGMILGRDENQEGSRHDDPKTR